MLYKRTHEYEHENDKYINIQHREKKAEENELEFPHQRPWLPYDFLLLYHINKKVRLNVKNENEKIASILFSDFFLVLIFLNIVQCWRLRKKAEDFFLLLISEETLH